MRAGQDRGHLIDRWQNLHQFENQAEVVAE